MLGPLLAGIAALLHAVYSLSIKYGFQKDDGQQELPAMAMTFWLNIGVAVLSVFCLSLAAKPISEMWLDVVPVAVFYFAGLIMMVKGFQLGQASVVGPLLGTKVFFAAFTSVLIAKEALNPLIWVAVVVAVPALILVSYKEGQRLTFKTLFQISSLLTVGAALCYAITDGFSRRAWLIHEDRLGVFLYCNIMIGIMSLFLLLMLKRKEVIGHDRKTFLTIGWTIFINGVVLTVFFYALTMAQNIAVTNIIFSTRTVIIIPLTLLADRLLRKKMDDLTKKTFWIRLVGALILMITIGLCIYGMKKAKEKDADMVPDKSKKVLSSCMYEIE